MSADQSLRYPCTMRKEQLTTQLVILAEATIVNWASGEPLDGPHAPVLGSWWAFQRIICLTCWTRGDSFDSVARNSEHMLNPWNPSRINLVIFLYLLSILNATITCLVSCKELNTSKSLAPLKDPQAAASLLAFISDHSTEAAAGATCLWVCRRRPWAWFWCRNRTPPQVTALPPRHHYSCDRY